MNKIRKKLIITGIVLLSVGLLFGGGVFSRYIYERSTDTPIQAEVFCFESNFLTEDNHIYKINAGVDGQRQSISIDLYNFENELRISTVACTYTITVTTDDDTFSLPLSINEYTVPADGTPKTTRITLDNLKNGYTYEVSVTANGGYEKTLSAIFQIAETPVGFYMNVSETDQYVLLTVWTESVSGDVQITIPAGLIPDATDPLLNTINNYADGHYVSATVQDTESFRDEFSSHSYRFFKTADYNSGDFTVKLNDILATPSNLK